MKTTDRPRGPNAETRWYEAGIRALDSERLKHAAEAAYLREDTRRLVRERREWESDARARRTYDFSEPVEYESAARLIETLSDWAAESDRRITLRLMTPGGDEISGLAIVDFVLAVRAGGVPVDTLALGEAASMGAVLLQCGEVRYVAPSSVVLVHESRTFGEDAPVMEKLSDMESRLRLGHLLEERCNGLLAERSVFGSAEELAAHYGSSDWWLTAEEAVKFGFADALWRGGE